MPQRIVETLIPKPGGRILVVRGSHKGAKGDLMERDNGKDRALVQLDSTDSPTWLSFDDVCEILHDD